MGQVQAASPCQNKQAEQEFFDKFGEDQIYDVFTEEGYQRILDEFQTLVQPQPGERFADFGCGSGAVTWRVGRRFDLKVQGTDISSGMIEANRKRHPEIDWNQMDIENTNLPDHSFDIIMFSGVLHHFPDMHQVLKEAYRLLSPGGRIFAFDPHYYNPFLWIYRADESPLQSKVGVTENERLLTKREIDQELKKVGYADVHLKTISGVTYTYVESKLVSLLLKPYNFLEKGIDLSGLGNFIGSFIITLAKKPANS